MALAACAALAYSQVALSQQADDPAALIERAEAAVLAGRRDEAMRLAEQAAAACMLPGPEARTCIYVLGTAAELATQRRRHQLAVRWAEREVALTRETFGPSHAAAVHGLGGYAQALRNAYRFAEAEAAYRAALAASDPAQPAMARLNGELADLLREAGRYDEAGPLARHALEQARAGDERSIETGVALDVLGRILFMEERFFEAEPVLRGATEILRNAAASGVEAQNQPWLTAANNLALTLAELRRFDEAEPLQREILAEQRRRWGEYAPQSIAAAANLARTASDRGRQDDARDLLRPALAAARGRIGADSPEAATLALNLGRVEAAAGAAERAVPLLEEAVRIRHLLYGDRHPSTIDALEALGRLRAVADPAAALDAFGRAAAAVAANAGRAAVDPRSALALRARRPLFIAQLDALWASGRREEQVGRAFEAAQWAMTSEGAAAISRVAARRAGGSDQLANIEARRAALVADRTAAESAYYSLVGTAEAEAGAERERLSELLATLDARIRAAEAQVAELAPAYFELSRPSALSAADARRLLGPDEALLVMLPAGEATHIFALTSEGLAWVRADGLPEARVAELVERVRRSAQDDVNFEPTGFDRMAAFELHRSLVAPLAEALNGRSRLIVVADGALAAMPPSLLVMAQPVGDSAEAAALQTTAWLSDRYAISSLPAVGSLHALRCLLAERQAEGCRSSPLAAEPRRALVRVQFAGVGAPALSGPATVPARGMNRAAPAYGRAFAAGLADPDYLRRLAPLPGAARELELLRATFNAPSASLLTGPAAREAAVKSDPAIAGARFLVFSTHGLLASESGVQGEPGLVLTPPDIASRSVLDDGLLTASEAAQLSLAAELLVLSACNTGTPDGDGAAGGLSGLSRAFFLAGAKALVVSHWAVSDDATAALMAAFFRRIEAEPEVDRAILFGRAIAEVRRNPEWASPGFWSAFSLIGTGD